MLVGIPSLFDHDVWFVSLTEDPFQKQAAAAHMGHSSPVVLGIDVLLCYWQTMVIYCSCFCFWSMLALELRVLIILVAFLELSKLFELSWSLEAFKALKRFVGL